MSDASAKAQAPTENRPRKPPKPLPPPRAPTGNHPRKPPKPLPPMMRSLMSSFNPGSSGAARFSLIKGETTVDSTAHPPPPPPMQALQGTISFDSGSTLPPQARRPESNNHTPIRDSPSKETEVFPAQSISSNKRPRDENSSANQENTKRAKITGKIPKNRPTLQLVKGLPNEIGDMILLQAGPVKLAQLIRDDKHYSKQYGWGTHEAQNIWRRTLQRCNPPPPMPWNHLTHERLAWLLFAKGCSEPGCSADRTETVLWEFGLRLCKDHQQLHTRNVHDLDRNIEPSNIQHLVPRHTLGGSRSGVVVHTEHVAAISQEFKDLLATTEANDGAHPLPETVTAWTARKRQENDQFMQQVAQFRTWLANQNFQAPDHREIRRELLQKLALETDPDFTPEVLNAIPAFVSVVSDKRELKRPEYAFRALLPKLQAAKGRALEMLERNGLPWDAQVQRQKVLHDKAKGESHLVWEWLRDFSNDVVRRLGRLAPQDFVLRTLDEIRSSYYALPENERPSDNPVPVGAIWSSNHALQGGQQESQRLNYNPLIPDEIRSNYYTPLESQMLNYKPHVLNLGDAMRIFTEVLEPRVPTDEIKETLKSFKCAGCKRRVPQETPHWEFGMVLRHISNAHNQHLDLFEYHAKHFDFPLWVEWPPTLPVLAEHHFVSPTGECDLQQHHPYQSRPAQTRSNTSGSSAFQGRSPTNPPYVPGGDFMKNLLFALRNLQTSGLQGNDSRFLALIALQFAIQRFQTAAGSLPKYELIRDLLADPEFMRLSGMFGTNKCGQCVIEEKKTKKSGNKHSVEWLVRHWGVRHMKVPVGHWTDRMIELPSEEDLGLRLLERKAAKARAAFDVLFPVDSMPSAVDDEVNDKAENDDTAAVDDVTATENDNAVA